MIKKYKQVFLFFCFFSVLLIIFNNLDNFGSRLLLRKNFYPKNTLQWKSLILTHTCLKDQMDYFNDQVKIFSKIKNFSDVKISQKIDGFITEFNARSE